MQSISRISQQYIQGNLEITDDSVITVTTQFGVISSLASGVVTQRVMRSFLVINFKNRKRGKIKWPTLQILI